MSQKKRVEKLEQAQHPGRIYALYAGDLAGDALQERLQDAHERIDVERDALIVIRGGFDGGKWAPGKLTCWQY